MKILAPLVAACMLLPAYAQPPEEIPQEVKDLVNEIAQEYGLTTFGPTLLRELDDGDHQTVDVTVAPDKLTYVALEGADGVIALDVQATVNGKELAVESGSPVPVLQIPAGNGGDVQLKVEMTCEEISCGYFIQAFVR